MFSLHKQTDYALLTIWHLRDKKEYVSISELVEQSGMPQRFLARITADLVKEGILKSKEGRSGGYILAKKLEEIPLFDFLKLFEGEMHIVNCADPDIDCNCEDMCGHKQFFSKELAELFKDQLKSMTLADIFTKKIS